MCLLKREQTDTGCGHPDCKNYYMLNKQLCMHNPLTPQIPTNMLNLSTLLLQAQNPPNSLSPAFIPYNTTLQQSLNTKRLAKLTDKETEENDATLLNKKKMKLKDSTNPDGQPTQHSSPNNTPFPASEVGVYSQIGNPVFDNRNLMNTQLLNNIMLSNSQANFLQSGTSQFGDVFTSILQNPQGSTIVGNGNNQLAGVNIGQLMAQNMKLNAPIPVNSLQDTSDSDTHVKAEYVGSPEFPIKEFQTRIFGLLSTQNKMLYDLKEKNEGIQDTLACLISEINILKNAVGQNVQSKPVNVSNPLMSHQNISNSSETASTETLINYLYGPKPNFQYQLVLKSDIALPLYRERNFKFTVILVDQNGKPVTNANRIPLTIGIYSSENPPKYIDVNTAGNKILKGFIEKDLVNGAVTFEKIQVKEVTSHFRNGWIFFVVYPKVTKNANNNVLNSGNGVNVDMQSIKPLIVEKVIVKAKKTKEKDQNIGVDESPSSHNE